jgi:hypothetical protein
MNQKRVVRSWRGGLTVATLLAVFICAAVFAWTTIEAQKRSVSASPMATSGGSAKEYTPANQKITVNPPVNFAEVALRDKKMPPVGKPLPADDDWQDQKPFKGLGVPIVRATDGSGRITPAATPVPSVTGVSPGTTQVFKGEGLNGTSIPPDTMGAVGTNHVVVPTNTTMRITDRNGVELSRVTTNSFWAGTTIKGSAVTSAFDPKIYFDRFNNRFIFVASLNGPGQFSGMGVAVTQTADPTGLWNRYTAASDAASTAASGHAIDYPSVGFNSKWIVVDENTFNYSGTAFTSFYGTQVFIFDKQAAYAGTLGSVSFFDGPVSGCVAPFEGQLGCGFTMAPSINEENATANMYMAEDWDNIAGQLRISKITGTAAAPVLTIGTQFPQSPFSWQFNAARVGTSGGYAPQKDQIAYTPSTQRLMTNDSRIQNLVYRSNTLWATHTVMLAATPTAAGLGYGTTNPDIHSGIQWWKIDPSIETGLSTPPLDRGRLEDTTADNCNSGNSTSSSTERPGCTVLTQKGQFYAFPNISVNVNNDVLIGFTQFSPLTYASSGYMLRRSTDLPGTFRDPVLYRPGQANYNIGAGTGNTTSRQNRWGDYSASQTDPTNDTDFWTIQEYGGTRRDFGIGIAGPWETYWARVNPALAAPTASGKLIISEFRFRGPLVTSSGARNEYIELYNPGTTPLLVNSTDGSDGWSVASNNGTTTTGVAVIPNGTIVPAKGHLLITDNVESAAAAAANTTYSLSGYAGKTNPATLVRGSDGDIGWSFDIADASGIALFKTSTIANYSAGTEVDAVGSSTLPAGSLFKEGAGVPMPTSDVEGAYFRQAPASEPQDSNANETDFLFGDTQGSFLAGIGQHLAAPGPENLESPIRRLIVPIALIDRNVAADAAPNQVFSATPVTNGPAGSVSLRRTLINTTGQPVNRLRFRITNIATFPSIGGSPDLRVLSSTPISVTTSDSGVCGGAPPCSVTAQGLTLEEPPNQPNGGGYNTSLAAGTVTFAAPLAPNARINLNFLFGVAFGGPFGPQAVDVPNAVPPVNIVAEVVMNQILTPTAANVSVSGRVLNQAGYGVARATVTVAKPNGETVTAITNAFGYFTFDGITAGQSYFIGVRAKGMQFNSQLVEVTDNVADLTFVAN